MVPGEMNRRGFLTGLAAAIAAPYVVRSGVLMPVKQVILPVLSTTVEVFDGVDWKALAYHNVREGKAPDYRGVCATLLDYARERFPLVRVAYGNNWTPRVLDWKVGERV